MIVSIIGDTDKRPVIYTLLKIFQTLGDVVLITNERHYGRLIEKEEEIEGIVKAGYFQNTFIAVTDKTPDEARVAIQCNKDDYDYIIYDNKIEPECDKIIYIAGCEMSESEKDMLGDFEEDEYVTIGLGFGKKNMVKYSVNMFTNCELIEGKHTLLNVDNNLTNVVLKVVAPYLGFPAKTVEKAIKK